jgi:hypothetical protein
MDEVNADERHACPQCEAELPPTANICFHCRNPLAGRSGPTSEDDEPFAGWTKSRALAAHLSGDLRDETPAGPPPPVAAFPCCPGCAQALSPSSPSCPACGRSLRVAPTLTEGEPNGRGDDDPVAPCQGPADARPTLDDQPPWMLRCDLALGLLATLLAILGLRLLRIDRDAIVADWAGRCVTRLQRPDDYPYLWVVPPRPLRPGQTRAVIVLPEGDRHRALALENVRRLTASGDEPIYLERRELGQGRFEALHRAGPKGTGWVLLQIDDAWYELAVDLSYWIDAVPSRPAFAQAYRSNVAWLHWPKALLLLVILAGVVASREAILAGYRDARYQQFEQSERQHVDRVYGAKSRLDHARQLALAGDTARSLIEVNHALGLEPGLKEAEELKQELIARALAATPEPPDSNVARPGAGEAADTRWVVYLRVVGTPFVYQGPPGAERITVGRKRRKGPAAEGNDFVIRIPGDDATSLRISRHHLEINRIGDEFFVIDRSQAGTSLKGVALVPDRPARLTGGDRMVIANVLALGVEMRREWRPARGDSHPRVTYSQPVLIAAPGLDAGGQVELEASLGDLLTIPEGR